MRTYRGYTLELEVNGDTVTGSAIPPADDEEQIVMRVTRDDAEDVLERLRELVDEELGLGPANHYCP